jgi:hypothetical protein
MNKFKLLQENNSRTAWRGVLDWQVWNSFSTGSIVSNEETMWKSEVYKRSTHSELYFVFCFILISCLGVKITYYINIYIYTLYTYITFQMPFIYSLCENLKIILHSCTKKIPDEKNIIHYHQCWGINVFRYGNTTVQAVVFPYHNNSAFKYCMYEVVRQQLWTWLHFFIPQIIAWSYRAKVWGYTDECLFQCNGA